MPKYFFLLFPFLLFSQTKDFVGLASNKLNNPLESANFYDVVKKLLFMSIYYPINYLSPTFNIKN
jgi:hypothetical protein